MAVAPTNMRGVPAAGMPAAGMPAAGMPAAGMPATGTPAAGSPAAGSPAAGFTLIELLLSLSLLLILCTLASPSFTQVIQTIRLSGTVHELHGAILRSRTEAIKRNSLVQLRALDGDWTKGWQMLDRNGRILTSHAVLHPAVLIETRLSNGMQSIAFDGVGHNRRSDASGGTLYGQFRLSIGTQSRLIVINAVGHSRICNPARDRTCGTQAPQ